MTENKNSDDKRPSLWQFLISDAIKAERVMFFAGFAIAMVGLFLIKNDPVSFIVTAAGSLLTFSVTDAIMKKVPK